MNRNSRTCTVHTACFCGHIVTTCPWSQTVTVVPIVDAVVPVHLKTGRFSSDVARSVHGGGFLGWFGRFFALFVEEALHLIRSRWRKGKSEGPRYLRSSARRGTLQPGRFRVQTSILRNAHACLKFDFDHAGCRAQSSP